MIYRLWGEVAPQVAKNAKFGVCGGGARLYFLFRLFFGFIFNKPYARFALVFALDLIYAI